MMTLTRPLCLLAGVLLMLTAPLRAQDTDDFVPLFGAEGLDGWVFEEAEADSFKLNDGVLVVQGEHGWLRSPREYGDFILRAEFRFVTLDADSGIFLRAGLGTPFIRGWPGNAYQVQTRDITLNASNSPLPLAQLYRHQIEDGNTQYQFTRVHDLYTGVGEWQRYEIRVLGDQLTVTFNGEIVTMAENIVNASGYLGFQSETGIIEFRNLMIYEP